MSTVNPNYVLLFTDDASRADITLMEPTIDVGNILELSCSIPGSSDNQGNPPATDYTFKDNADWTQTGQDSVDLPINSVTQEGNYFCAGVNFPDSYPGGIKGAFSEPKHLAVLGNCLLYQHLQ